MSVDDFIYPHQVPFDFAWLEDVARRELTQRRLRRGDRLELYATGFTPAVLAVVNVCCELGIDLVIYHFNPKTKGFDPQPIKKGKPPMRIATIIISICSTILGIGMFVTVGDIPYNPPLLTAALYAIAAWLMFVAIIVWWYFGKEW